MTAEVLHAVLEATGYVSGGRPAQGVVLDDAGRCRRRGRTFTPDALWRGGSSLTVYFKYVEVLPSDETVAAWRQEVWNEGFAPLLWVISPKAIDLYNGFGQPQATLDALKNRLKTFKLIEAALADLDALAGRLAMETGKFWLNAPSVDRKNAVDRQLLRDLTALEHDLVTNNLERSEAQALIGRSVFTQFLVDRGIVNSGRLEAICGYTELPKALRNQDATCELFSWLGKSFNGDMFPRSAAAPPHPIHLERVADFLEAVDPETGQTSLFPYQFDVIPVELISSIYERFAHSAAARIDGRSRSTEASRAGVYYTRLPVVSLILNEVMDGLAGDETVLDLTCGSGVFLVEAFRKLVELRSRNAPLTRALIREVLASQIFGVDDSEAAIRVAAFSLYLAALELDPDPQPPEALTFEPLIGRTLLIGDARTIEATKAGEDVLVKEGGLRRFDIIVGNPPWSFRGRDGTENRRIHGAASLGQPRGEGLDFVERAKEFAHERTRFGMVLSAMAFFSRSGTGAAAALRIVSELSPVTLVNLSNLSGWLFAGATMPAVVLFARHRKQRPDRLTVVQVPWSLASERSHTFEIAPSDIIELSIEEWERQPVRLKAAALGRRRDLRLLDDLTDAHKPLQERLQAVGTDFGVGLILGREENQTRDAQILAPLEFLQVDDLEPFAVPRALPTFGRSAAQWPRSRKRYVAPLLLVKEMLTQGPRPVVGVSDRDLVFSNAYFGAPIPEMHRDAAHVLAGILSSALASWFFIMTAAEFGLWKRRLLQHDVAQLPIPDLERLSDSKPARKILDLEQRFRDSHPSDEDWANLDEAVFDIYNLDAEERIVVKDGLIKASWAWRQPKLASVEAADPHSDLKPYAETFSAVVDRWLSIRRQRGIRAEIYEAVASDALCVVRFVLEQRVGPPRVEIVPPDADLADLLNRIGERLKVPLAAHVTGLRELRVYGADEVVIIKPAARRHWMRSTALEDADAVVAESFARISA